MANFAHNTRSDSVLIVVLFHKRKSPSNVCWLINIGGEGECTFDDSVNEKSEKSGLLPIPERNN